MVSLKLTDQVQRIPEESRQTSIISQVPSGQLTATYRTG